MTSTPSGVILLLGGVVRASPHSPLLELLCENLVHAIEWALAATRHRVLLGGVTLEVQFSRHGGRWHSGGPVLAPRWSLAYWRLGRVQFEPSASSVGLPPTFLIHGGSSLVLALLNSDLFQCTHLRSDALPACVIDRCGVGARLRRLS